MAAARQAASSTDVHDALAEILKLLDITLDMERNADDAAFHRSGGQIHYVFDENVFEMFIDPWRWKGRTATFYSYFWHKRAKQKTDIEKGSWSSISAQSALLAAEYLFSNDLPGQRDSRIFVTEWHLWELRRRLQDILGELRARLRTGERRRRIVGGKVSAQPFLAEDLMHLEQHDYAWTQEAIDRFIVTRTAAHALATDPVYEPIEQIDRLVTGNRRDMVLLLDEQFSVPPTDYDIIRSGSEAWLERLRSEDRHPDADGRTPKRQRSLGSLRTDAQSLAYVQWITRHIDPAKERIVLVTGDETLFNAYSRWHCKVSPADPEYVEPFALRRLVQYVPIFNMNDAEGDFVGSNALFDQTRAAVEVALLPFNLAQLGAQGPRLESINRGREFLALRRIDSADLTKDPAIAAFADGLTPEWLEQSRASLDDLTELWQQTERVAIGSMYSSIVPRLNSKQRRIAARKAEGGASSLRPGLTTYVGELLDRIVEGSVQLWYPLAIQFITRGLTDLPKPGTLRVRPPINLKFPHGHPTLPENLGDLLLFVQNGSQHTRAHLLGATREFAEQPALLFGVAATLALSLRRWSEAERFAELAKQTMIPPGTKLSFFSNEAYEFVYLHALSKRFRIGELMPLRHDAAIRTARRTHGEALAMLNMCERAPALRNDPPQLTMFKRLRALSERAALNQFFAIAVGFRSNRGETPPAEVNVALDEAERDLLSCLALVEGQRRPDGLPDLLLFAPVRRQFLSNIAALGTLRAVFGEQDAIGVFADQDVRDDIRALLDTDADLPYVVRLELRTYLALTGDADAQKYLLGLDVRTVSAADYALDKVLERKILSALRHLF